MEKRCDEINLAFVSHGNIRTRGGFRVQKKVVTNFCKIDTIYIKVIALIFVAVAVIIIIANAAILFCFEILVVAAWYMPMLVASEIP